MNDEQILELYDLRKRAYAEMKDENSITELEVLLREACVAIGGILQTYSKTFDLIPELAEARQGLIDHLADLIIESVSSARANTFLRDTILEGRTGLHDMSFEQLVDTADMWCGHEWEEHFPRIAEFVGR